MATDQHSHHSGFHGPRVWVLSLLAGILIGAVLTQVIRPRYEEPHAENGAAPHVESDGASLKERSVEIASEVLDGGPPLPYPPNITESQAASPHAAEEDHGVGSGHHGPSPTIPLWLVIPFAVLLMSIALMPFINARVWHNHFPDFAFFLGGLVGAYYLVGFNQPGYEGALSYGQYKILHAMVEYYAFIALVGGLYVVSGSILVDVRTPGRPVVNTALLAFGAVMANLVGTTGASMLLIRPFMRINKGRLQPIHIVFFIFIVSNCGGCLTPIGDPPLYLGYLKGVPFFWTLEHLWYDWAFTVGLLLGLFFVVDSRLGGAAPAEAAGAPYPGRAPVAVRGSVGLVCLGLMIVGVFVDPLLDAYAGIHGLPIGATFQILVAAAAYRLAPRGILAANDFNFFPVKEVGLLFLGIFATMVPALGYLSVHGPALGLNSPTAFYFGTGILSAFLDNAPTYLNFLQIAFGNPEFNPLAAQGITEMNPATIGDFVADPKGALILVAVSTGAVFFGAMTYIGNGPNFMVKAIAENAGVRMPSFFGYMARALVLLLPVLVLQWALFIRGGLG